jgi:hypothetical protein
MTRLRKEGTNPRALGLNPRKLGVSPRQIADIEEARGLDASTPVSPSPEPRK